MIHFQCAVCSAYTAPARTVNRDDFAEPVCADCDDDLADALAEYLAHDNA